MAKWKCVTKKVPISRVKASHPVRDDHQTRSGGQNIAVTEGLFSYSVYDGNHRLRDAKRAGHRHITVDVWSKR